MAQHSSEKMWILQTVVTLRYEIISVGTLYKLCKNFSIVHMYNLYDSSPIGDWLWFYTFAEEKQHCKDEKPIAGNNIFYLRLTGKLQYVVWSLSDLSMHEIS